MNLVILLTSFCQEFEYADLACFFILDPMAKFWIEFLKRGMKTVSKIETSVAGTEIVTYVHFDV